MTNCYPKVSGISAANFVFVLGKKYLAIADFQFAPTPLRFSPTQKRCKTIT
jgi:hypothetical protein